MPPEPGFASGAASFGFAGALRGDVDRFEGAAGAGHELLHLQLGLGEELRAALVEGNTSLVERERAFERLATRLELGNRALERRERVVERELVDRGVGPVSLVGTRVGLPRPRCDRAPA